MKISKPLLVLTLIAIAIFSCKSKKDITKIDGSQEIEIPLSGKQYESDKDFFRAKQVGESPDLSTAKKMAEQNAKAELAGNIESLIKRVTDQYTNQRSVGNNKDFENKFEEMSREVVNQELRDVKVIGEKLLQKDNKIYQYWIAVESPKEVTLSGIYEGVSDDAKLQLDFDKAQFEKIFTEEMEKFESNTNGN